MEMRQKKSMRWAGGILLLAVVLLIGALLFGSEAWDAAPPDAQERTEAIKESGFTDDERAGIEALVHDYIVEHPDVITEALGELRRRDTVARLDKAGDTVKQPFAKGYIGNANAKITLVEFSDYACGYCRKSVDDIEKLVEKNPDLRVVFRETPILSPASRTAALWSLAAAEQDKYAAFHKAMFAGGRPSDKTILAAARSAGMDIAKAKEQIKKPEYAAEIDRNINAMRSIGASGTPTFIIGDELIEGAVGYDGLQQAVEKART